MILIHSIAPSSANTSRLELDDKIDQLRHVNAERDNLKDDIDVERRKAADAQRQITTLQEQIHRHDIASSELRAETLRLKETITETERLRDDARSSHGPLEREIVALKEKLAAALAHHEHVNNERDAARQQLENYQTEYEETMETFDQMGNVSLSGSPTPHTIPSSPHPPSLSHEQYQQYQPTNTEQESAEYKIEIESLTAALNNARELRDHAVTARNEADRNRDHYVALFDKKCRELETFREERDAQLRVLQASSEAHAASGGGASTRYTKTVKSSGGGGFSSSSGHRQASGAHSHGHSHEHGHSNGQQGHNHGHAHAQAEEAAANEEQ